MPCTALLTQFYRTTRTHCTNTTYLLSLDTIQCTSTTLHMNNLLHLCTSICCSTNLLLIYNLLHLTLLLCIDYIMYSVTYIAAGIQLYKSPEGGQLKNQQPSKSPSSASAQKRAFFFLLWNKRNVRERFSKTFVHFMTCKASTKIYGY